MISNTLLLLVSLIDWHYQLIPLNLCQLLLLLGMGTAWQNWGWINATQSIESIIIAFCFLCLFYLLCRFMYRKEVFGQGDYIFFSALASFHQWEHLPWILLLASSIAIIFYFSHFKMKRVDVYFPFAPFLAIGSLLVNLFLIMR